MYVYAKIRKTYKKKGGGIMKLLILSFLFASFASSAVKDEFLDAHNYFRESRNFEAIQWSKKLQRAAKAHADKCTSISSGTGYGESIYVAANVIPPAIQIVHGWKPEQKYRNFYQSSWLGCARNRCDGLG